MQNSAHEGEQKEYASRIDILNWFFFELLLIGYVEDSDTGLCFHFPEDLKWTVYIEARVYVL